MSNPDTPQVRRGVLPNDEDRRFTETEAATYFGVVPRTVRNWIYEGRIRRLKHGKGNVFLREHILEAEQRMTQAG